MKINFKVKIKYLVCMLLFFQACKPKNTILVELKRDIIYLSDDKLEGRETGTKGEDKALEYLKKRFDKIGIKYIVDTFQFNDIVEIEFKSNIQNMYPTRYSSSGEISNTEIIDLKYGIEAPELNYSDYKNKKITGKTILVNTSSPDGIHPHSKYLKYHDLKFRAEIAKNKGAACVIYYTDNKYAEVPGKKFKKLKESGIPVLFFDGPIKSLAEEKMSVKLKLTEKELKGKNLIAHIDNQKNNNIIIGAHYDHIGWGKEGSRYTGEPDIHNGADDNASGVSALLQLAKFYKNNLYNSYNYIFIAFSGEEKGLLGSNAYIKKSSEALNKVNYMINMDMIGRLDTANTLQIYGTGTSPSWNDLIDNNNVFDFNIKKSKSGIGPSDHTTFYLQDIPVLHFFTGVHEDYHKPSDDAEKINYQGIVKIIFFIQKIINDLNNESKIIFTKTKENQNKNIPKFSVTLGVIPDYLYEEDGMRIDGISNGRPAQNAGMKKGDVVVQLGKIKVIDMFSYMKALGSFVKGDTAQAVIIREEKSIELQVIF